MHAPQRMHFSECQNSGIPSLRVRPLSTNTICSSPPFFGPVKCEEYCVSGEPTALRDNKRRKTPMSSTRGTSFSMPMLAMCNGGTAAPMSAFPSFVQTRNVPVSAMAKFPPVHPRPRREKPGTSIVAHRFGQKMRIVIIRVRPNRPREELRYILPCLVNGRHDDMAWGVAIRLLNPFPKIGLRHLEPTVLEERHHSAFLLEHGLALDELLYAMF